MTPQERKDLNRTKAGLLDRITAVLDSAQQGKRVLTSAEKADIENLEREVEDISFRLNKDASITAMRVEMAKPTSSAIVPPMPGERKIGNFGRHASGDPAANLREISNFIKTGIVVPEISNPTPIVESGNAGASIPTEVLTQVLKVYPNVAPLTSAGATILNTGDGHPIVKPIVAGGAAAHTFSENDAVTTDQPPLLESLTFGAEKYERLVLASIGTVEI